jgi:hypothetical protein
VRNIIAIIVSLLKLIVIGGAFFIIIGGPFVLFVRVFPDVHGSVLILFILPWGWFANRFLLSPLEYVLGMKSKQYDPWYENFAASRRLHPDNELEQQLQSSPTSSTGSKTSSTVFFERASTFRRWDYVTFMIAFGIFALLGITAITASLLSGRLFTASLFDIVAGTLWTLVMASIAGILAYRVFFRPIEYSRIDNFGIIADGHQWPWNKIACVFVERASHGMTLCFREKGLTGGFRHPIHGMPPLSEDEATQVLERLKAFLATHCHHVSVR